MEATEYMYSGLPIGSVGRLSNHPDFVRILPILLENPESQPICNRDKKIPILKSVLINIFPNEFLWYLYKNTYQSILNENWYTRKLWILEQKAAINLVNIIFG